MKPDSILYRKPLIAEADAISVCIRGATEVSEIADGAKEGIEDWEDVSGAAAIATRIASDQLSLVARANSRVVGFIAYRRTNHLSLLFVHRSYQGQGVGRCLVSKTLPSFATATVNSTDIAVGFYQQMGFFVAGERFLKRGAWSTPMVWNRPD